MADIVCERTIPEAENVDTIPLPSAAHEGDAGWDLRASEDVRLIPFVPTLVPTDLKAAIPPGYVALICPRSGLALKHSVTVHNAPGVLDSSFRGEWGVILVWQPASEINAYKDEFGDAPRFDIRRGDRIAQVVLLKFEPQNWVLGKVDATARGEGGFGSSGMK